MERLHNSLKIEGKVHTDLSTAGYIGWVAMRDYDKFFAIVTEAALTGLGVTEFAIYGAKTAAGGTPLEIRAHAVASAPDALGDYLMLECNVEELRALGADYAWVSVKLKMANAADRSVVTYIRAGSRFKYEDLSADYVS